MPDDRVKITLRLDPETHAKMTRWTQRAGVSMNSALESVIHVAVSTWEARNTDDPEDTEAAKMIADMARRLDQERRGRVRRKE